MKTTRLFLGFFIVMTLNALILANARAEPSDYGGIDHSLHPHYFSVLLGSTYIREHGNGATIGVDYEYRLNDALGLGAIVEYADGELEAWTFLAVVDIHITPHWIMQIGPGYEHTSKHNLFVARIGTLYEFEFGEGWTLAPQLHYDYHEGDEDAIVWGVAIGKSF